MKPRGVLRDVGNAVVRRDPRTLCSKVFPDPAQRVDALARIRTPAAVREGFCAPANHRIIPPG